MNDVGTPAPPPERQPFIDHPPVVPKGPWPSGGQAAMLLAAGLVLGIGGCFAFVATMNMQAISMIFGGVFFIGLIVFLLGCLEVIIIMFRGLFRALGKKNG